jgi:hypothetical protein
LSSIINQSNRHARGKRLPAAVDLLTKHSPAILFAHFVGDAFFLTDARARRMALSSGMPAPLRFPPPWSVEERQSCFIVKDGNGQTLAYVYFEEELGRRAAENLMSHDEAGALAVNIAKLPELLCKMVD